MHVLTQSNYKYDGKPQRPNFIEWIGFINVTVNGWITSWVSITV